MKNFDPLIDPLLTPRPSSFLPHFAFRNHAGSPECLIRVPSRINRAEMYRPNPSPTRALSQSLFPIILNVHVVKNENQLVHLLLSVIAAQAHKHKRSWKLHRHARHAGGLYTNPDVFQHSVRTHWAVRVGVFTGMGLTLSVRIYQPCASLQNRWQWSMEEWIREGTLEPSYSPKSGGSIRKTWTILLTSARVVHFVADGYKRLRTNMKSNKSSFSRVVEFDEVAVGDTRRHSASSESAYIWLVASRGDREEYGQSSRNCRHPLQVYYKMRALEDRGLKTSRDALYKLIDHDNKSHSRVGQLNGRPRKRRRAERRALHDIDERSRRGADRGAGLDSGAGESLRGEASKSHERVALLEVFEDPLGRVLRELGAARDGADDGGPARVVDDGDGA
uniref:Uncharacterized protein n=1 Tax=Mycena chlorophos TaxID=658473 RepID=A0ABQ0M2M3_MYCCL|nr:predicted protein [Mycena chlorophos]